MYNKAVIRIVSFFMAMVILLVFGLLLGIQVQAGSEHDQYNRHISQSGTIAIVSQDQGVEYDGKRLSFSTSIIKSLEEDIVLVSRAESDKGLKDGKFAAVITFPSNFSSKIAGINLQKPEKANFYYKINDDMSQSDTITTLIKIMQIEQNIKESISFMFMASIMNELHMAQEETEKVLENNYAAVKLVQTFNDGDYGIVLEFSEIDSEAPKTEPPDFNEFNRINSDSILEWSSLVQSTLSMTNEEFQSIKDSGVQNIAMNVGIQQGIESINLLPKVHESLVEGDLKEYFINQFDFVQAKAEIKTSERINKLIENTQKQKDDTILTIGSSALELKNLRKVTLGASELESFEVSLGLSIGGILKQLDKDIYKATKKTVEGKYANDYIDAVVQALGTSDLVSSLGESINIITVMEDAKPIYLGTSTSKELDKAEKSINKYIKARIDLMLNKQMYSDLLKFNQNHNSFLEKTTKSFDSIIRSEENTTKFLETKTRETLTSLQSYIKGQEAKTKASLSDSYKNSEERLKDFEALLLAFEVLKNYNDNSNQFSTVETKLHENTANWNEVVYDTIANREEILYEKYGEYQEHLYQLMEDLRLSKEDADAILSEATMDLLVDEISNMENTEELLELFSKKLPNSHVGTQGNNDYYDFVINPINASQDGVDLADSNAFNPPEYSKISNLFTPLVYVLLGLLVVAIIFTTVVYAKYRKLLKNDKKKQV